MDVTKLEANTEESRSYVRLLIYICCGLPLIAMAMAHLWAHSNLKPPAREALHTIPIVFLSFFFFLFACRFWTLDPHCQCACSCLFSVLATRSISHEFDNIKFYCRDSIYWFHRPFTDLHDERWWWHTFGADLYITTSQICAAWQNFEDSYIIRTVLRLATYA